jgi:NAD(P)-dependent dehydrogenase (short-subunit alcohol dehydrogenase family)
MPPKVWFIAGASKSFSESLLERGDKVAAASLDTAPLARLAAKYGDRILPMRADPGDPVAIDAAVARARERFGRLDVLFDNPHLARSTP